MQQNQSYRKERGMIKLSNLAADKLQKYRELYEHWQKWMEDNFNIPFEKQEDNLLLAHALDDAIEKMEQLLSRNEEEEQDRGCNT